MEPAEYRRTSLEASAGDTRTRMIANMRPSFRPRLGCCSVRWSAGSRPLAYVGEGRAAGRPSTGTGRRHMRVAKASSQIDQRM